MNFRTLKDDIGRVEVFTAGDRPIQPPASDELASLPLIEVYEVDGHRIPIYVDFPRIGFHFTHWVNKFWRQDYYFISVI